MSAKPRVLLTTATYLPAYDGVAVATANLAEGLAKRGFTVSVVTCPHPERKGLPVNGVPVYEFDVEGRPGWRAGLRGDVAGYQRFVAQFPCEVLICQYWNVWSTFLAQKVFPAITARKVLVSHGFSTHLLTFHRRPYFGIGQWIGRLPIALRLASDLRLYDQVVLLSEKRNLRRFIDHLVADLTCYRRHTVIPNGVWPEEFANAAIPFRALHGIGERTRLVLCVANYSTRKNQIRALRVFADAALPDAAMVFIGSERNEYMNELEAELARLRSRGFTGDVKLMANLSRAETCAAYRAADAFLLTAKAETQPIALLEAMVNGVPFVAAPSGAITEMPGGITALTNFGLVRALRRVLLDDAARAGLAAAGRDAIARQYHWRRVLDGYERLIRDLLPARYP